MNDEFEWFASCRKQVLYGHADRDLLESFIREASGKIGLQPQFPQYEKSGGTN